MTAEEHDATTQPKAGGKSLAVLAALKDVKLGDGDIVGNECVRDLSISGGAIKFTLVLPPELMGQADQLSQQAAAALRLLDWTESVEIAPAQAGPAPSTPPAPAAQQPNAAAEPENPLPGVKHVIAVGSGKGGVGKSTVSVNLALALVAAGHKVGLLDADVYGPSIPLMLGVSGQPMITKEERIIPLQQYGLKLMSMGFLLAPDQAVVWRGPLITGTLQQFLFSVNWGDLDVLIIDLPPGTGDVQITLAQKVLMSGALVVSTPQDVALIDAHKAIDMFQKVRIPVLGLIENMAMYVCPQCGHEDHIFGTGGVRAEAERMQIPFLAEIPLAREVRTAGDAGLPIALGDGPVAEAYRQLARELVDGQMA